MSDLETLHVRHIEFSDYLPGEDDDFTLSDCVNQLLRLGKHCGLEDQQAIQLCYDFVEVVDLKLGVYWEVVETYCDGALKPAEGRALIEKLGLELARGNHELFESHLRQLVENFCFDQLGSDPHLSMRDQMEHPMDEYDVWRNAWEAAENRGICPDQEFVDSISMPKKINMEIGDISGIGNYKVRYHFPIDEQSPEDRAVIREAFEKGFSLEMKVTDEHGNVTTREIKIGGEGDE